MKKTLLAAVLALSALALQACAGGEITAAQQKAKKDELQKVADDHPDPNREVRPR